MERIFAIKKINQQLGHCQRPCWCLRVMLPLGPYWCDWPLLPSEAMVLSMPCCSQGSYLGPWLPQPESMLISVTCTTIKSHVDACCLGCHLKPSWCARAELSWSCPWLVVGELALPLNNSHIVPLVLHGLGRASPVPHWLQQGSASGGMGVGWAVLGGTWELALMVLTSESWTGWHGQREIVKP